MNIVADSRTSASHPLRISAVSVSASLGRVGITFCPGKKQPAIFSYAWDRDLESDVRAIAGWGATTVITLIEPEEFIELGVERLGDTVVAHRLDWLHLPIGDRSIPDATFEQAWQQAGATIRSRLRAGFDVLVHCKTGLGRAGTIASRILIDTGIAPEVALAAVRKVRPGAVDSRLQERYVLALLPVAEPTSKPSDRANVDWAVSD